jgi:hypothetical protein
MAFLSGTRRGKPMTNRELAHTRLYNQRLAGTPLATPEEVVAWLGAVQSQDYAGAKWAISQRTPGLSDAAIEAVFAEGRILRTHVLRPTWHFVTPADIRWLLAITAPRIHALNAYMVRQLELDDAIFARSNVAFAKAMEGGRQLTRAELGEVLAEVGIEATGMRLGYLLHRAELDAVVCSGARRGKQFTYALLDERAPNARTLTREEALAELTRRYFASHGPATLKDFTWWCSLTLADARAGMELVKEHFVSETIGDQTFWFSPSTPDLHGVLRPASPSAYLLPNYDEYGSYADHSAILDAQYGNRLNPRESAVFNNLIVIDGQILGTWRRTLKKKAVVVEILPFRPFNAAEESAVNAALARFGHFLDRPVVRVTAESPAAEA